MCLGSKADTNHVTKEPRHPGKVEKWDAILDDNKELPPAVEKFLLDQLFSLRGRWVKLARRLDVGCADLRQDYRALARRATVSYAIACGALFLGLVALGTGICLWALSAVGLIPAGTLIGVGVLFKTVAAAIFRLYDRIDNRQHDASRRLDAHCRLLQAFQMVFFLPSGAREKALERVITAHLQGV